MPDDAAPVHPPRHERSRRETIEGLLLTAAYVLTAALLFALSRWLDTFGLRTTFDVHAILESTHASMAVAVGGLTLVRYYSRREAMYLYLGIGFLGVAAFDLLHIATTTDPLRSYFPSPQNRTGAWGWWIGHLYLSIAMMAAWLAWRREESGHRHTPPEARIYLFTAAWITVVALLFLLSPLPPFPRALDAIPALFFGVAFVGFWFAGLVRREPIIRWLSFALLLGVAIHLFFTPEAGGHLDSTFTGAHLLKLVMKGILLGGLLASIYDLHRTTESRRQELGLANQRLATEVGLRRRAENQADSERRLLLSVFDSMSEGAMVATSLDDRLMFNRAARDILGLDTGQMTLADWDVRMPGQFPDGTALTSEDRPIRRALRGEVVDHMEIMVRHPITKEQKLLSVSASPLIGGGGAVAVFHDITSERAAQRALAAERERYRSVVRSASDAIVVADQDGNMIEFNAAAELMFGHLAADVLGQHTQVLVPEHLRAAHLEGIRRYLLTGQTRILGRTVELPALHADGTQFPVELVLSAWQANGRTFFTAVIRDITERKAFTAELETRRQLLEQRNQELQDFASVASHDLQEPLRKVIAFGQRLEAELGPEMGSRGGDYLQRMRSAATRMKRLIDALLAYSRVTTQAQPFVEVDLEATATAVVSDLETRVQETGGAVELGPLPVVQADPLQMQQLLQNLIGNALKYHRPGVPPLVRVTGRTEDGEAVLVVEDNGIGIDDKYFEHIFRPFQRLHGMAEYEGTGMGLAIVRRIVERHRGAVRVESEAGVGSRFIVRLPLAQPQEPASAPAAAAPWRP